MQTDSMKLLFTYGIATVVVVGGGFFLFLTRGEPTAHDVQLAIVGFIGGALAFVFNRESATQATRAAQSSNAAGAATASGITPPPPNPPAAGNP